MSKRKYEVYGRLYSYLRRKKVKKPGKVATLLLDTFIYAGGDLRASTAVKMGICEENKFKQWVTTLSEWIYRDANLYTLYYPKGALLKYINEEKSHKISLASDKDVQELKQRSDRLEEKSDKLEQRVGFLEKGMTDIINIIDPPSNKQKIDKMARGGYHYHLKLVQKG